MINMMIGTCYGFTLNLCRNEWHVLQHEAAEIMAGEVLHCIPQKMTFHSTRTVGDEDVDFYYRLNKDALRVEFVTIPSRYERENT